MGKVSTREAFQIGCLSLRFVLFIVFMIIGLLAVITVFPILLLIFLAIPFLFLL